MSYYTTELRHLIAADYNLGLDKYPIFDEKYRGTLNQKIIDHYYYREIGAETPERFVHYLNAVMNEQMPYFNLLYRAAQQVTDPMKNKSVVRSVQSSGQGTNQQLTQCSNENTQQMDMFQVESDTPAGLISAANIKGNLYASKATRQDNEIASGSEDETSTSGQSSTEQETSETLSGFDNVTQAQLFAEYKAALINIDMLVIDKLAVCFMGVY
jgi:DNA gyrase/topoisomerase IV subunit B